MRLWPIAVACGLAATGCADERMCANPEPGTIEVGVGDLDTGFVPVGDGDEVTMVLGPQGLHMVLVSARVRGFELPEPGQMVEVAAGIRSDGDLVGGTLAHMEPERVAGEQAMVEFLGLRAAFTIEDVRALENTRADLEVIVTDACGRELEGSASVTLAL